MDNLRREPIPLDLTNAGALLDIPECLRREAKPVSTALTVIETAPEALRAIQIVPCITREEWLERAVLGMRPWFALQGKPLPDKLRVSIGFAFLGRKFIGECWSPDASSDGTREIFLSPVSEPIKLLGVLVHELCHAALPFKTGHRKPFSKLGAAVGLVGPWKSTGESPGLVSRLNDLMATKLGPIPHATLNPGLSGKKKQTTRMQKCECLTCGYTVRVTAKWLEKGAPICPTCHDQMAGGPDKPGDEQDEEGE